MPVFRKLATIGWTALAGALLTAVLAYPVAYLRRVKYLLEGASTTPETQSHGRALECAIHAVLVRRPIGRAVFHFINQTLLRVPRYRIYLVLYGGVGLSLLIATVLRLSVENGELQAEASADGIRVAAGIVAFWVTIGLRTAFVSSGNQRGGWIFRFTHGRPAHFEAAIQELRAGKIWVLLSAVIVTIATIAGLLLVAPGELLTAHSVAAQFMTGIAVCVLLSDAAFLRRCSLFLLLAILVQRKPNLAFTLLKFFTFFPFVTTGALVLEMWIEENWAHLVIAGVVVLVGHWWFRYRHREVVRIHSMQAEVEEGEDEFPMRLGLRY